MKTPHFYLDTSVIGGCHDEEFREHSTRLIDAVRSGRCMAVISEVVLEELTGAPPRIQDVLRSLPTTHICLITLNREAQELRDAYILHGVLTPKSLYDATHVALATLTAVDAIVSWNFKHIVRFDRIRGFNGVNMMMGYGALTIISPLEVRFDED